MKKRIACLLVLTMVLSCLTACTMYVPQSDGSIMTGEVCADMAGIKVMLRLAAENPDFDYDKFFRSYATLQQYDEFLDFYVITEGDGMYLAPENRVAIW